MPSCTIVIGAERLLPALRERAGSAEEILTFSDTNPLGALEAIMARRPQVIAVERLFAATSRGAALINRIKADPSLALAEIRVVSHDSDYTRISPRRTDGPTSAVVQPPPAPVTLDYRGTRRAARFRMVEGTPVQIDGAAGTLLDLSTVGAQVTSPLALKPLQRVRVALTDDRGPIRFAAAVSWASFEIPKASAPRYRAGLVFLDAEPQTVEGFCRRHQKYQK